MYTLNELLLTFVLGFTSSLAATYCWKNQLRLRRKLLYYTERLSLPVPIDEDRNSGLVMFWFPVVLTVITLISVISLGHVRQEFLDTATLHYISFPSYKIDVGYGSAILWFLGLSLGIGLTYLKHYLAWWVFNTLPLSWRTYKTWGLTRLATTIILVVALGALISMLVYGTPFWRGVSFGFGLILLMALANETAERNWKKSMA